MKTGPGASAFAEIEPDGSNSGRTEKNFPRRAGGS